MLLVKCFFCWFISLHDSCVIYWETDVHFCLTLYHKLLRFMSFPLMTLSWFKALRLQHIIDLAKLKLSHRFHILASSQQPLWSFKDLLNWPFKGWSHLQFTGFSQWSVGSVLVCALASGWKGSYKEQPPYVWRIITFSKYLATTVIVSPKRSLHFMAYKSGVRS